jgi:hypothetical protein
MTGHSAIDFGQDRFAVGRTATDAKAAPEEETSQRAKDSVAVAGHRQSAIGRGTPASVLRRLIAASSALT